MTIVRKHDNDIGTQTVDNVVEQAMQYLPESLKHERYFEMGERLPGTDGKLHWKHRVWRNVSRADVSHVRAAARYYYGCSKDQERLIPTAITDEVSRT